jgi:hypothetical protein
VAPGFRTQLRLVCVRTTAGAWRPGICPLDAALLPRSAADRPRI